MITVKAQFDPEKEIWGAKIGVFGEYKHILKEYYATVEGIAKAILSDTPENLQSTVKIDILLQLMKTIDILT